MNKQRGTTTVAAVFILAIWAAFIVGWIANIIKLIGMLDGGVTAMFIARIAGIPVAPLGGILGYF